MEVIKGKLRNMNAPWEFMPYLLLECFGSLGNMSSKQTGSYTTQTCQSPRKQQVLLFLELLS